MKAGRQLDLVIAQNVMGYPLHQQNDEIFETTPSGVRNLHEYSSRIDAAWEVAVQMGITLIPIEGGSWFALAGSKEGWGSPAEFMECLQKADFAHVGAAVTQSAPLSICLAAVKAAEKRKSDAESLGAPADRNQLN